MATVQRRKLRRNRHRLMGDTNDTEQEDGQNGDDGSEYETFIRLDNRTYQCKFCPEIFSIHQMIRKHTKEQHPTKWKSFKCRHCNRRFASESIRDRHAHFHSLNHPFKCTECDQMYLWKKNLDKHFQTFHDRNSQDFSMERFHCESCELTFVEKKHYAMHSRIYHDRKPQGLKTLSDKKQVCERCVKTFDSRDLLREHIRQTHQKDPPLKNCICKTCSKDLKTVKFLRIHILATHFGIMPFICQHCSAGFSTRHYYLKHIKKVHSEVALFKCPSCNKSFTTESGMLSHKGKFHIQLELDCDPQIGTTLYQCVKCEKKFKSKNLLDKHSVRAHPSFMLIYKCPLCSKSVHYRKQHMRVDHDVTYDAKEHHYLVRYKCHCCSKLFQQKRNLMDHQNALSMQCVRCHMRFKTKKSLQAHMATHQANKSLNCEDCGLFFRKRCRLEEHCKRYHNPTSKQVRKISPNKRKRHIAAKHVQNEFAVNCAYCPVLFTDTIQLRNHYRRVHRKERVMFKCPECEKYFLHLTSYKDHYKKHRKEAGADHKGEVNSTSELVEDGVKESGQTKDQTAYAELESIVIEKEVIVQIGKAAAPGEGATTEISGNSLKTNQPSEKGMMLDHIAVNRVPSEFKVNCAHCPVLVTDTVQLRNHYRRVHRKNRVMFKCPECEECFLRLTSFKDHYKKHKKEAEEVHKGEVNSTSESVEDGVKESGQTTDQTTNAELESIVMEEEAIIQIGNAAASAVDATTGINGISLNTIQPSEQGMILDHIAVNRVPSEYKVNCAHCPMLVTDTVQLRKHYWRVHRKKRVMFKCPECEKCYMRLTSYKDHYKKHRKDAEADHKGEVNSTSELVEDGVKESGQTNDQTADAELESIVIEEEAIVQIENAAAPAVGATTGINGNSLNINQPSEQGMILDHIAVNRVPSEYKVNCAHCPVQVTNTVQLRNHYRTVHQKKRVMFKCPECEQCYLRLTSYKDHYQKHRKEAEADHKGEVNRTSESVEDGVKSGQTNDQTADVELESIVIEEEAIVQIGKAAAPGVGATTEINGNSRNANQPSEQGMMLDHIAVNRVPSGFMVKCAHCLVLATNALQLRKHYRRVHRKERVIFKCPECEKFYLHLTSYKYHYKKHRKGAEADHKGEVNSTSESVEDGVKESGQTNDQTAVAELESIVIKEEAIVQSDPVKDGVNKNDQTAEGELVSIIVKEEAIVQNGNAAASGMSAAAGIKESSWSTNDPSEQGVMIEIKQEPLYNGEAATSADLSEWEKSTAERSSEQNSAMVVEQKLDFVAANKEFKEPKGEPVVAEQPEPSVEHQVISIASDAEEKPFLVTTEELNQEEQMEVDEIIDKYAAEIPAHRGNKSFTSTQVLKNINCPYCPKLFANLSNRKRHIAFKHVQSEFQVNCGHCPVQVADTVQLRKHYKAVHPEERVTFKCPECDKFYLYLSGLKGHYKKHRKVAGADHKADMSSTRESIEDEVKESGKINDQTADGELVSIVVKEEAIVQIGDAAASGVSETVGIKDNSLNNNEPSKQGVMMEIKQKPMDSGEVSTSTDLTEWEISTTAEETDHKVEPINTSEPIEDGVNENSQNADGELVSIVVKEEAIVQIGNAAAPKLSAPMGMKDNPMNINELLMQRVKIEFKQEPLDNC